MMVKAEQREQPGHTPVAIGERVDAEEVECQGRKAKQGRRQALSDVVSISLAEFIDGGWGLAVRNGTKPDARRSARSKLHNVVGDALPFPRIAGALLNGAMQAAQI